MEAVRGGDDAGHPPEDELMRLRELSGLFFGHRICCSLTLRLLDGKLECSGVFAVEPPRVDPCRRGGATEDRCEELVLQIHWYACWPGGRPTPLLTSYSPSTTATRSMWPSPRIRAFALVLA